MTQAKNPPVALITGASSGIGAAYADRLARRGHNLVLVARSKPRLDVMARDLADQAGVTVETLAADLTDRGDLTRVEARIRDDASIGMLINDAGLGPRGTVLDASIDDLDKMVQLNVVALHRLTRVAVAAFVARGGGAVVNLSSIAALMPERFHATYAATKAFILALTQALHSEVAQYGVRMQAVLPGLTATPMLKFSGYELANTDASMVMDAGELVDAALVGLDKGELVTIPSLSEIEDWMSFEAARAHLVPNLSHDHPSDRYRALGAPEPGHVH